MPESCVRPLALPMSDCSAALSHLAPQMLRLRVDVDLQPSAEGVATPAHGLQGFKYRR
jgi:hypothetical protein